MTGGGGVVMATNDDAKVRMGECGLRMGMKIVLCATVLQCYSSKFGCSKSKVKFYIYIFIYINI